MGMCWSSTVIVMLSSRVCMAWQSSPSNIIFICYHPLFVESSVFGSMSNVLRKSTTLV